MPGSLSRRDALKIAAALCGIARAQDTPTFSAGVKVVNVLATVRNKTGALVGSLGKDDFLLSEEGRPQTIRYFSRETDLPLTLGLMVDTSGSQRHVLDAERGASLHFLDRVIRPVDKVFIMQFDTVVQMRQELTSAVGKLDDALAYVDTETRSQVRAREGGGTLLYDAIVRAAYDVMRKLTGRKALIVLSDGVDYGSENTLQDALDTAQRADTLIYSILYGGTEGKGILERLSEESGGSLFEVSRKHPVDEVYDILQEELRNQYNLGYVSDKPVTLSGFRKIQLTAKQKGLLVQARHQYWAQR
jgi:VWFA-related protein